MPVRHARKTCVKRGPTAARQPLDLAERLTAARVRLPEALPPGSPLQARYLAAIEAVLARPDAPVAADPASLALLAEARQVARTPVTVLLTGPSGTGKEVLARYIHAESRRAAAPFLALNCAALPEAMTETLLFGHEKGAFTGADGAAPGLFRAASGGTLFLDEVGELAPGLQAKLLRAIEAREVLPLGATRPVPVDVRLVAATNRDLAAEAESGRFRPDLFWRLAVFPLATLPLARRPADILPLAAALLIRAARTGGQPLAWPTDAALERLATHDWPGNVRELDNCLQRAAILAAGTPITPGHLRFEAALPPQGLAGIMKSRENEAIRSALALTGGRRALAARHLGISERTLRYKLAELAGRPRTPTAASRAHALEGDRLQ
ncbi:sigma 54-interacting transcriptional regulator [Thermaurantiacus sp.]